MPRNGNEWECHANLGVTRSINPGTLGSPLYGLGTNKYLGVDCSSIDGGKNATP